MKYFVCLFSVACIMTSCRSHNHEILGIDTMKVVMWDMLKMDEVYLRMLAKDSTAAKRKENIRLYEEVFALHHISKGQFDSSYKFYESHPVNFKLLIDSLNAFGTREKNRSLGGHVNSY